MGKSRRNVPPYSSYCGHMKELDERIQLKEIRKGDANWTIVEGSFSRVTLDERNQRNTAPWNQQQPIVMLMACESAATTTATVNNFVLTLNAMGSSAIVGTECSVNSNFAAEFAQYMTIAMLTGDRGE